MHVDHAEDALELVLQRDPVAHRAEIIAEMEIAGGLDAREDAPLEGHGKSLGMGRWKTPVAGGPAGRRSVSARLSRPAAAAVTRPGAAASTSAIPPRGAPPRG